MGSQIADPVNDHVNVTTRTSHSKKSPGKAPRKIHKAAREKLKRDHMNELFFDLGRALDLDHPNNGKAAILRETVRLLGELLTQVDNLRKENITLLSESNYITTERDELLEETSTLDAEIKKLRSKIDERAIGSNLDVSESQNNTTTQLAKDHVAFPVVVHASESTPAVGPVFVVPLNHESQGFHGPFPQVDVPKVPSSVSKPRPRYPSSEDSWPSQILTNQTNLIEDV